MNSISRVLLVSLIILFACTDNSGNSIDASGTIEGTEVRVGAEVTGRVLSLPVDEGTAVQQGDTVAIIDDSDYRIQLRQAAANATSAEAQYRLAVDGPREEDIAQAEAAFQAAKADYERAKELVGSGTITQKYYDDTYARFVAAEQTYQKLVSGLRRDEVLIARARWEQAAAQADLMEKKIRDCSVIAPAGGVVTLKGVEEGELVVAGGNLMRITKLDTVKLVIYVSGADIAQVRLGQPAEVTVDGQDKTFPGTVIYISSIAEFTPKNVQTKEERTKLVYAMKIRLPNPDGILKPGMPADASLEPMAKNG